MSQIQSSPMPIGTPLRNPREELYAQARSKLVPSRLACVQAGFPNPHNAARVERRGRVQRRIAELRHHDEVNHAWQRKLLRDELMRIALARLPDLFYYDESGCLRLRNLDELSDDERAIISEIWRDKDGIERAKAHSKTTAIDLLMKLDGLAAPECVDVATISYTEIVRRSLGLAAPGEAASERERS